MGPLNYKCSIPFIYEISPFLRNHPEFKVVFTSYDFNIYEQDIFRQLGISDQIIHYFVPDNLLDSLYHYAFAFVYPSEYEGFGLPILEAYKNNCPVILNNASCFPEIAENAALYFNVKDIYSLNNTLEKLFNFNNEQKNNLLLLENKQLKKYSWEKTAREYINMYNEVYESNKHIQYKTKPIKKNSLSNFIF